MKRTPVTLGRSILVAALVAVVSSRVGAQEVPAPTGAGRAAKILDGRGNSVVNGVVVVRGQRIVDVLRGAGAPEAVRRAARGSRRGSASARAGLIDGPWHINR